MVLELLGEIAEERELEGTEGLGDLIRIFTEKKASLNPRQPSFEETDKLCYESRDKRREGLVEISKRLLLEVPLYGSLKDVDLASQSLVADFLDAELRIRYDRISPELFSLQRGLFHTVKSDSSRQEIKLVLPVLASVKVGEQRWELQQVKDEENKTYKIEIGANVPPITSRAKQDMKEFMAVYMAAVADSVKVSPIGDFLIRDLSLGRTTLDMRVCWIPDLSDLEVGVTVIDKDPFIIGRVCNNNYLVTAWDIEGELPYQHYLREFTESKAG
jgi:hypothetical protein